VVGIAKHEDGLYRGEVVAFVSQKGEGVGLGITQMTSLEMARAREGIAARTDRVFMEPGTYPKMWESSSAASQT